ncbi:Spx/MgsR family RNA polymerase-binding regulatory protein [Peptostreptococcus faecalis]|uniref:Spx/MgsR family RNA polymerase-binding regulatory protein n=1 Tax=Peptostreptococcus faecalis TaxID=2045015 RepID=UPI000C7D019E|nr:Spx/MgsR family RNA polymerase-binding regulatory protein [Peptostreptococcus faecalis]
MNILLCYKSCTTCKGVEKIMKEKNIPYEYREISVDNPTEEELRIWKEKSGLEIKKFFNTNGKIYRDMGLSKKLPEMSDDEKYELLSSDGMLVKRPILLLENGEVYVGPDVKKFIVG